MTIMYYFLYEFLAVVLRTCIALLYNDKVLRSVLGTCIILVYNHEVLIIRTYILPFSI